MATDFQTLKADVEEAEKVWDRDRFRWMLLYDVMLWVGMAGPIVVGILPSLGAPNEWAIIAGAAVTLAVVLDKTTHPGRVAAAFGLDVVGLKNLRDQMDPHARSTERDKYVEQLVKLRKVHAEHVSDWLKPVPAPLSNTPTAG